MGLGPLHIALDEREPPEDLVAVKDGRSPVSRVSPGQQFRSISTGLCVVACLERGVGQSGSWLSRARSSRYSP